MSNRCSIWPIASVAIFASVRIAVAQPGSLDGNALDVALSVGAPLTVSTSFPPSIVVQPTNQTAPIGRTVTFSVGVTAAPPPSFQWKFNDVNLMMPSRPTLSLTNIQFTNAGSYSVAVSNSEGVVTSDPAVLTVIPAPTGPGQVDVEFLPADQTYTATAIAAQPDGKVLIGGGGSVIRFNADGTRDTYFVAQPFAGKSISAMALQPDGRILVGGGPSGGILFARLNSDGSPDANFLGQSNLFQKVNALVLQPDGRIITALTIPINTITYGLRRFNSDGTVDGGFAGPLVDNRSGGGVEDFEENPSLAAALDRDRNILLAIASGGFGRYLPSGGTELTFMRPNLSGPVGCWAVGPDDSIYAGVWRVFNSPPSTVVKLRPDGTVDSAFPPVVTVEPVNAIQVQPDGKILIAGSFTNVNGIPRHGLARLHPNGSIDLDFPDLDLQFRNDTGTVRSGAITGMVLTADCKLMIGGRFTSIGDVQRRDIARLHLDNSGGPAVVTQPVSESRVEGQSVSFSVGVTCVPPPRYQWFFNNVELSGATNARLSFEALSLSNAGPYRVVVSNTIGVAASAVAQLTVNPAPVHAGSLAPETLPDFGANGSVLVAAEQTDGRRVIGGQFTFVNGVARERLARLNVDGSLDLTFNPAVAGQYASNLSLPVVTTVILQPDGRIVVAGTFRTVNGIGRTNIARLFSDGTLDESFSSGGSVSQPIYAMLLQGDGRIVVGRDQSSGVNPLARLNTNGSPDTSFAPPGNNHPVYALALMSDGRIVAGGGSGSVLSSPALTILNPNGTLNAAVVTANRPIRAMTVLPDNTLLVGGSFSNIAGNVRLGLARLNTNGMVLSNLWANTTVSGTVRCIQRLSCGKFLIGGSFTNVNGFRRMGIARLNEDGTLDQSYDPGTGANGAVLALALQADGRAFLGGEFSQINGTRRDCLARLNSDPFTPPVIVGAGGGVLPGGTNATFHIDAGCWLPTSTFQWLFNGTNIFGATGPSLIVSNFNYLNVGTYSVLISNALGQTLSAPFIVGLTQRVHAGAVDLDFYPRPPPATNTITPLALTRDGRIFAATSTNESSSSSWSKLFRLLPSGELDPSFGAAMLRGAFTALAVQTNGFVSGALTNTFGPALFRWNLQGAVSQLPSTPLFPITPAYSIVIDRQDRILLAGDFSQGVARLFSSGGIDTNFHANMQPAYALAEQPNGRILVARRAFLNGQTVPRITRLYSTGAVDMTFRIPTNLIASGLISVVGLQSSDRVIAGGAFRFGTAQTSRYGLARFDRTGALDLSFNAGLTVTDIVNAVVVEPNDKLLVAGLLRFADGSVRRVARLHPDGALDPTFDCTPGPDGTVDSLVRQPDGRVLVSGRFRHINGIPRPGIARLLNDPALFNPTFVDDRWIFSVGTIGGKTYTLESKESLEDTEWIPRASVFGVGNVESLTDPLPPSGQRFYRVRME